MAIAGIVGLIATPTSGALIHRFGARAVVATSFAVSAAAYAGFLLVDSLASFILVASLAQAADRGAYPAEQCLMAAIADGSERVKLLAFNRSIRNAGFALGALLAAAALANGSRAALAALMVGNGFSYALAVGIVLTIPVRGTASARGRQGFSPVLRNKRFVILTALCGVTLLHTSVFTAGLPIWVTTRTPAPATCLGVMFAINTVLVMLLQVRAASSIETVADSARMFRRAGVAVAAAFALFAAASQAPSPIAVAALLLGTFVLTLGEVWTSTGEFAVSMGLSGESNRGPYLAFFSLSHDVQQILGPLAVLTLLHRAGTVGWLVLAVVISAACVISASITAAVPASESEANFRAA
jgi:MFS family permease